MDTILVVNAGSSSVKFQVFSAEDENRLTCRIKGQVDGIGSKPRLRASVGDAKPADRELNPAEVPDVPAALHYAGSWLRQDHEIEPLAIGHRVVHGGPDFDRPVLIDSTVLSKLERFVPLAPLHQPNNLAPIRATRARFPTLPQVACFDTAFHRGHGPLADHFALPTALYDEGVRRYGFHGLSYEYIAQHLKRIAPEIAERRVVVAHLGSGASLCALSRGQSVDSTMGFTALDGLVMGTRPGQLDAGVILYLIAEKGMTPAAVQDMLYHDCGLKGLSGISNDMRELLGSSDRRAAFAIDYFVQRVVQCTGMMAAALGGIDGFVFTAGIGENAPALRARIVARLDWLGLALDATSNAVGGPVISSDASRIPVLVVPTNEEIMIARHTLALVSQSQHERVS
jgi:acetate kinase